MNLKDYFCRNTAKSTVVRGNRARIIDGYLHGTWVLDEADQLSDTSHITWEFDPALREFIFKYNDEDIKQSAELTEFWESIEVHKED